MNNNKQTIKQTNKQSNKQTNKQSNNHNNMAPNQVTRNTLPCNNVHETTWLWTTIRTGTLNNKNDPYRAELRSLYLGRLDL